MDIVYDISIKTKKKRKEKKYMNTHIFTHINGMTDIFDSTGF